MTDIRVARQPLLKAGKSVAPGLEAAPGGSVTPRPSITFDTDATLGPYISEIALGDLVFRFSPVSLFYASIHHVANNVDVQLSGTQISHTITEDETTGIVTIVSTFVSYANISSTLTLTPIVEGYQIGISSTVTSAVYALEWIEFPRLGCQAPSEVASNAYLAYGFVGGMVSTTPHMLTLDTFDTAPGAPPSMQFWDYYDISTKAHLYISTDDDSGYPKLWVAVGDRSSVTRQAWRHYFANPRRVHNGSITMPMTTTYHVNIELFKGQTADGRCGHYDSAIRYRTYGIAAARPWVADGPWAASANVSSRVKNSDFYYVRAADGAPASPTAWSDTVQDMARIQSFVGATHMLGLLYGWSANMDFALGFYPPKFTPLTAAANMNTALGTAAAANIHLSLYTLPCFWETSLTSIGDVPFRYNDFIGTTDYNEISQFCIRDTNDAVITNVGGFGPGLPVVPG